MTGYITRTGPAILHRGILHRLPATPQPIAQWVAELDICPVCHSDVCDCITPDAQASMLARIDADPHGVTNVTGLDIPY